MRTGLSFEEWQREDQENRALLEGYVERLCLLVASEHAWTTILAKCTNAPPRHLQQWQGAVVSLIAELSQSAPEDSLTAAYERAKELQERANEIEASLHRGLEGIHSEGTRTEREIADLRREISVARQQEDAAGSVRLRSVLVSAIVWAILGGMGGCAHGCVAGPSGAAAAEMGLGALVVGLAMALIMGLFRSKAVADARYRRERAEQRANEAEVRVAQLVGERALLQKSLDMARRG